MIRVTVSYSLADGGTFDLGYYCREHATLVHRLCDPIGLRAFQIDESAQAKTIAAHLLFEEREDLMAQLAAVGPELAADSRNYTDIAATTSVSTVIHQS